MRLSLWPEQKNFAGCQFSSCFPGYASSRVTAPWCCSQNQVESLFLLPCPFCALYWESSAGCSVQIRNAQAVLPITKEQSSEEQFGAERQYTDNWQKAWPHNSWYNNNDNNCNLEHLNVSGTRLWTSHVLAHLMHQKTPWCRFFSSSVFYPEAPREVKQLSQRHVART